MRTRVYSSGGLPAPLPFSHLMHVDRLGCIYHAAARLGLGDARSPATVARVLRRVLISYVYVRTCVHARRAPDGAARSRGPVSRVDNGGRHAETRAATVLRLCLRSVARATCATPSASVLPPRRAMRRNAQVIFSKSSRPFKTRIVYTPLPHSFSFSSFNTI